MKLPFQHDADTDSAYLLVTPEGERVAVARTVASDVPEVVARRGEPDGSSVTFDFDADWKLLGIGFSAASLKLPVLSESQRDWSAEFVHDPESDYATLWLYPRTPSATFGETVVLDAPPLEELTEATLGWHIAVDFDAGGRIIGMEFGGMSRVCSLTVVREAARYGSPSGGRIEFDP